jgi:tRNA modification GTPase
MRADDTIFALSSGTLPAGLAVVRLSGPKALETAQKLSGGVTAHRQAHYRAVRAPDGRFIDRGLVITFPGPRSFTGEDCVEFHLHGSRAVVATLYEAFQSLGLRQAEAGEFSRRALENGKMDLVEAEGLADLLRAETEMQRRLAVEQSEGGLSALYIQWARALTHARAMIEAELDFSDEEDVPGSVSDLVWPKIRQVKSQIDAQLEATKSAEIIRDGFHVAIVGAPNAGKSSLLNALANRDVAIVTEIAGTTRDVLSVDLDIDGYLVRFFDTAGIRETNDVVEIEGIRRARAAAGRADLVLYLHPDDLADNDIAELWPGVDVWRVRSKADLKRGDIDHGFDAVISSKTKDGLIDLKASIARTVTTRWQTIAALKPGRLRHAQLLEKASNFLQEALEVSQLDIQAECLRLAADELGRITGHVDVEKLLDIIFSEFCIGK